MSQQWEPFDADYRGRIITLPPGMVIQGLREPQISPEEAVAYRALCEKTLKDLPVDELEKNRKICEGMIAQMHIEIDVGEKIMANRQIVEIDPIAKAASDLAHALTPGSPLKQCDFCRQACRPEADICTRCNAPFPKIVKRD